MDNQPFAWCGIIYQTEADLIEADYGIRRALRGAATERRTADRIDLCPHCGQFLHKDSDRG